MYENLDQRWFTIIGLFFDIIGALIIVHGLIISKNKAFLLGSSYIRGKPDESSFKSPPTADRIKQSKNAILGGLLLIVGFVLQIIGNWPK
jgi:hypothetical protein